MSSYHTSLPIREAGPERVTGSTYLEGDSSVGLAPGRHASAGGDSTMRKYGRIAVLGVALFGAGSGCSPTSRSPFVAQADARINIEVTNNNFQDATLYAIWTGERRRLGVVTIGREGRYIIPWPMSLELRFEIDLLVGPKCTTEAIMADPGDIIVVEIRSQMVPEIDCAYYTR